MERTLSTEEKIRRAEEIYNRRKEQQNRNYTARVNINEKKDLKLLKKIIIQIIACLSIYSIFYIIKNNNYIFTEDFLNKSKEILAYDINFQEIYLKGINLLNNQETILHNEEEKNEKTDDNMENTAEDEAIGGAVDTTEEIEELSQMEQDALEIKNTINFINPIEGTVTSKFGWRNPSTTTVPKYHTGVDIANITGTIIKSATDGDVILASNKGDYRKSFENTKQ